MADIIRNRNKEWEEEYLQRNLLAEVQTILRLREMLDSPELLTCVVDFVLDQFPVNEKDKGDEASEEWWKESLRIEDMILDCRTRDELYQLAMHPLKIKKEEDT